MPGEEGEIAPVPGQQVILAAVLIRAGDPLAQVGAGAGARFVQDVATGVETSVALDRIGCGGWHRLEQIVELGNGHVLEDYGSVAQKIGSGRQKVQGLRRR